MKEKQIFDCGDVLIRVEPDDEGDAFVTILSLATDSLPPQQIFVAGECVEGLIKVGRALQHWKYDSTDPKTEPQAARTGLTIKPIS
jgi:hypothetical protein